MTKRIFLIHGWGESPNSDWFPWTKKALTDKGYKVFVPEMPDTEHPKIEPWVEVLTKIVENPKPDDIFIGHSIGCQAILRYLEKLDKKVGKVILVAPWWYLTLDENEEQEDADPWLNTLIDFSRVKKIENNVICIFSKDDPWVPYKENVDFFKKNLNPKIITKDGFGHFTADEGSTKIEFLLDLIE
jgi:predicted alpha/beta hydrolase family esterase